MDARISRCCRRHDSKDRENWVRLDGFGDRGLYGDKAESSTVAPSSLRSGENDLLSAVAAVGRMTQDLELMIYHNVTSVQRRVALGSMTQAS